MQNKITIIAEAGVNHNGNLNIALNLIDVAARCGADIVKFQLFRPSMLASKTAPKSEYQTKTTQPNENQLQMLEKIKMPTQWIPTLIEHCKKRNIQFLCTPFDNESAIDLYNIGLPTFKIASADITNYPLLKLIGSFQKKVILSTGMATIGEIDFAINTLTKYGTKYQDITLLHCTTEYPCPYEEVNLKAIKTLKEAFKLPVGLSDHSPGIEVAIASVSMGVSIIEKHFTLDKNMPGPDHKASLSPEELQQLVTSVRNVEKAMGNGIKRPTPTELKNIFSARRSIVAKKPIKKGELFSEENITTKRPANGLSPMLWELIIDKPAQKDFQEDEPISI